MRSTLTVLGGGLVIALACGMARAEPVLQLYIEGATYDSASETWVLESDAPQLRLWTIGNVGQAGAILDVKVALSYDKAGNEDIDFFFTPSTTGGYGGFTDGVGLPQNAVYLQTNTNGDRPKLYGGQSLPPHDAYGPTRAWQEFLLGDFTLTDSPIADFGPSFPAPTAKLGQINVYEILMVNAAPGTVVHIDLYNHVLGAKKGKFAPFSHDAAGTPPGPDQGEEVPSPVAILLAIPLLSFVAMRRVRVN